jgi:hypothetical protein
MNYKTKKITYNKKASGVTNDDERASPNDGE